MMLQVPNPNVFQRKKKPNEFMARDSLRSDRSEDAEKDEGTTLVRGPTGCWGKEDIHPRSSKMVGLEDDPFRFRVSVTFPERAVKLWEGNML